MCMLCKPASDKETAENPDDFLLSYNVNGIRMSEAAFRQLGQEISLEPCRVELPQLWGSEDFRLHAGLVPLGGDIFRKIVVRASRVAQIDPREFSLKQWTERCYYEVCTNPAVYAPAEAKGGGSEIGPSRCGSAQIESLASYCHGAAATGSDRLPAVLCCDRLPSCL